MENNEEVVIKEGNVVSGKITGIQPYGLFVKLTEECSGLVHRSELDEFDFDGTDCAYKIGQPLSVKILRVKPGGKQAILRIHHANFRKRRTAKNFETVSGFTPLKEQLPQFIEAALEHLNTY